jgi:hypothetical protein
MLLRAFLVVLAAAALSCGRGNVNVTLQNVPQARELSSDLMVQFTRPPAPRTGR